MGFIYKITSPTGRIYVGQTRNAAQRISDYKSLRHRSKKSIIIWSIKKHGWNAHRFEIIEEIDNSLMDEREIFWIDKLKTFYPKNLKGMNLTKGGGGVSQPWKHNLERVAKAKLRCGANSPGYGKTPSIEVRKKIAESVSKYNIENGKKPLPICYEILRKKQSIPVLCYDLNGVFLLEYESITYAAKVLGIDRKTANDNLNGKQQHGGGYIFKKKAGDIPLNIDVKGIKFLLKKRTIICVYNGEAMEFSSFKEASIKLNIKKGTITDAFYNGKSLRSGHFFRYKDEQRLVS